MDEAIRERYLRLGLQVGRHVEGMVDAYFGPPELKAEIDAAAPVAPRALVAGAESLLGELEDGWLHDQVVGLRTFAGVLAGETIAYAHEVEGCYGVRPVWTDESVFGAAHSELEELLPGAGPLRERHARWEESIRIPGGHVEAAIAAVIEEARAQARTLVELPGGEGVEVEIVRDVPWLGFCEYHGALRSTISVNAGFPMSAVELLRLVIHETYPGHHTERCVKDEALVRGRGLLEETIVLVPTPQSLIAEGIATLAPLFLLEGDGGAALVDVVRGAGVELDLAHALAVENALKPCRWAEVNAALMLHADGAGDAEAQAYLERWGLLTPELAAHVVRFLHEPTSRSYILTYSAGYDLCRAYVGDDRVRFRRLLSEQARVGELIAGAGDEFPA